MNQKKENLVDLELGRGLVYIHLLLDLVKPRLQAMIDLASRKPQEPNTLVYSTGECAQLIQHQNEMVSNEFIRYKSNS